MDTSKPPPDDDDDADYVDDLSIGDDLVLPPEIEKEMIEAVEKEIAELRQLMEFELQKAGYRPKGN